MCGIVAAVGQNNVIPLLIDGLKKLEYRGYDSTGVGFLQADHRIHCERSLERVAQLEVQTQPFSAHVGIAHTRWATHGAPALRNAHPMESHGKGFDISLVHNGIIENFSELRDGLTDFIDLVLPELRRRGLFRTEYEGVTLRNHLGLARPEAAARPASAHAEVAA